MICDYHLHCNFSGDSEASPEEMIEQAIGLGMPAMCFTDHYDMDYPDDPELFLFNLEQYFATLESLQAKYKNRIDIRIGIELGLQPHLGAACRAITTKYPFDFVIGSSHVVHHKDPYYPEYFEGRSEAECYKEYFDSIPENLAVFSDFDVYGHIDYIVRYGPNKNRFYSYEAYRNTLDNVLRTCIENGVGIEMNTGGLAYQLGHPNPHPDVLRRYRELGGEMVTIGSDGHSPNRLAYAFDCANELLMSCGFKYYTVFKNRKPSFIKL